MNLKRKTAEEPWQLHKQYIVKHEFGWTIYRCYGDVYGKSTHLQALGYGEYELSGKYLPEEIYLIDESE